MYGDNSNIPLTGSLAATGGSVGGYAAFGFNAITITLMVATILFTGIMAYRISKRGVKAVQAGE